MGSLRFYFSLLAAKTAYRALQLTQLSAGTSIIGRYVLKLCPDFLKQCNPYISTKINVTGTNGKTTTSGLITHLIKESGKSVINNAMGANMLTGVVNAVAVSLNPCEQTDFSVIESDEAYLAKIYDQFEADYLIVTNLFRDQLDRYGEIDITSDIIKRAIKKVPNLKLVLNGDDPLCVQFGREENVKAYYYGISEKVLPQLDDTKEGRFCPVCGEEQKYNYYHYSQLGDFYCPSCGFKRPEIDFEVKNVSLDTPMKFTINNQPMVINYKGFYNIYNLIAVYGALNVLGEKTDDFAKLLTGYKPQIGRMQEYKFNKPVILSLSKNPAGFNQAIATVNTDKRKKDVIIAINDKANDGRDVSWLWDVDFDKIADENLNTLTTTGIRVYDISLRFKYSDIKVDRMTQDMADAITKCLETDSEVVYVLVNYTALYSTEAVLKKLGGEA